MFSQVPPSASVLALIAIVHLSRAVALTYAPPPPGSVTPPNADPILELYMHDILGGTGHPHFPRPLGFDLPKSDHNGAIPTVNGNNRIPPAAAGLSGTTFMTSNGHAQLGSVGLGLGFGTITVINDVLTLSPKLGTEAIGKAQGVYVASSVNGSTQLMAFTAMIEGGEYGDTLNFFGVYEIGTDVSRLSVTGGTGKFRYACGFAEIRPLFASGQLAVDGAETLLRISVHLTY